MFSTSARSVMDDLPAPRESRQSTTIFYKHPYGGIARGVNVTREGFARFFEIELDDVDRVEHNIKFSDRFYDHAETMGYVVEIDGKISYWITVIDHTTRGQIRFHQQELRKAHYANRDKIQNSEN